MSELVADYVLKRLREWGVPRIYGFPGDGINAFLGALGRADGVDALIAAERGEAETALRLARHVRGATAPTDFFQLHGWSAQVLERVATAAGDEALAGEARREALEAYERKGASAIVEWPTRSPSSSSRSCASRRTHSSRSLSPAARARKALPCPHALQ